MTPGPARDLRCDFCGCCRADAALMFRGIVGGMPPHVCDRCVVDLARVVVRQSGISRRTVTVTAEGDFRG